MLYNKRWDKEVKADPFSLDSLIAWLEKQPADKTYCYDDTGHCLLAQWFKSCGTPSACLGNVCVVFAGENASRNIPVSFQKTAMPKPHTFGAALRRARSRAAR
jgi:hypothetical protein